ncbi:MAG TPA: hypothetical protein VNU93_02630, partial [Verrucomicrobiae bacterium]|nr:hypothetical protein [Verrucomicrobiae bacterium]
LVDIVDAPFFPVRQWHNSSVVAQHQGVPGSAHRIQVPRVSINKPIGRFINTGIPGFFIDLVVLQVVYVRCVRH